MKTLNGRGYDFDTVLETNLERRLKRLEFWRSPLVIGVVILAFVLGLLLGSLLAMWLVKL